MKVAPCGSVMTASLAHGASKGPATTVPPSWRAFVAAVSASSTPNVTLQCAGVRESSSAIGLIVATTSIKPSGPPISACCLRSPGVRSSR